MEDADGDGPLVVAFRAVVLVAQDLLGLTFLGIEGEFQVLFEPAAGEVIGFTRVVFPPDGQFEMAGQGDRLVLVIHQHVLFLVAGARRAAELLGFLPVGAQDAEGSLREPERFFPFRTVAGPIVLEGKEAGDDGLGEADL